MKLAKSFFAICTARFSDDWSGNSPNHRADGNWISLFNGKTLAGWEAAENPTTFTVQDGKIVVQGPRAHLFSGGRSVIIPSKILSLKQMLYLE